MYVYMYMYMYVGMLVGVNSYYVYEFSGGNCNMNTHQSTLHSEWHMNSVEGIDLEVDAQYSLNVL